MNNNSVIMTSDEVSDDFFGDNKSAGADLSQKMNMRMTYREVLKGNDNKMMRKESIARNRHSLSPTFNGNRSTYCKNEYFCKSPQI